MEGYEKLADHRGFINKQSSPSLKKDIIFPLYINDLEHSIETQHKSFHKVVCRVKTTIQALSLLHSLDNLFNLGNTCLQVVFNLSRCKVPHVGKGNPDKYTMGRILIEKATEKQYLQ